MPRSSKPRKAYRPQPVHANALDIALNNVRKLSRADVALQAHVVATSLQQFSAGQHCAHNWRGLADTANVAETLAAMGICSGAEADRLIERAQQALAAVHQRHAARGTWTLYAAELDALTWLAALHHKQLAECDYAEFERAINSTHERIAQARSGNAPRGAIVIEGDIAGSGLSRHAPLHTTP